ncbi:hypothetical protein Tco_0850941, partial [Tanacetum coccineum]
MKRLANMNVVSEVWDDIIAYLHLKSKGNSVWVSLERNMRIFHKGSRSVENLCNIIFETVSLKLLSLQMKSLSNV